MRSGEIIGNIKKVESLIESFFLEWWGVILKK